MMNCDNCENFTTHDDKEICAGAVAYEISNCDTAITDFRGLPTCNCCDECRRKCLMSMQEEYANQN